MSDTMTWQEAREFDLNELKFYRPRIPGSGILNAPRTDAPDETLEAVSDRARRAHAVAQLRAEKFGLKIGLGGLSPEERAAALGEIALARQAQERLVRLLNRIDVERNERAAERERDADRARARQRLASLEAEADAPVAATAAPEWKATAGGAAAKWGRP